MGPQGRSELMQKTSPPLGFDPQTFQPVARRYADCTIPIHVSYHHVTKCLKSYFYVNSKDILVTARISPLTFILTAIKIREPLELVL